MACRSLIHAPRASPVEPARDMSSYEGMEGTRQTNMGWPAIASQGVKSWRGHLVFRNASTGKTTGTVNISKQPGMRFVRDPNVDFVPKCEKMFQRKPRWGRVPL